MSQLNGFKRVCAAITTGAALVVSGLVVTAAPASAAVCGFQGVVTSNIGGNIPPLCVTPGETRLYANPNLGGLNFAYYIGDC